MKQRILYIMHVDWRWIKQRPHFLAEQLSIDFDTFVLHAVSRSRRKLAANPTHLRRLPIILAPIHVPFLDRLIDLLHRIFISILVTIVRPHAIWLTHPRFFPYLSAALVRRCPVVYDCMDDVLAFPGPRAFLDRVEKSEHQLVEVAAAVFCSSESLRCKIIERGGVPERIRVVRNAFGGRVLLSETSGPLASGTGSFRICYVGTISEWLDFDSLLFSLERIPLLEYHLVGPVFCRVPCHERLKFHGVISHEHLYGYIENFDAFILPFKMTPLVESVDPVKIYEYINVGKHIVALRYEEIERFRDFVDFYFGAESLVEIIDSLSRRNCPKYSHAQRLSFLAENDWSQRGADIRQTLHSIDRKLRM